MATRRLGELLLEAKRAAEGGAARAPGAPAGEGGAGPPLTPALIEQALAVQAKEGGRIGEVLVKMRAVTEEEVLAALGRQLDLPVLADSEGGRHRRRARRGHPHRLREAAPCARRAARGRRRYRRDGGSARRWRARRSARPARGRGAARAAVLAEDPRDRSTTRTDARRTRAATSARTATATARTRARARSSSTSSRSPTRRPSSAG